MRKRRCPAGQITPGTQTYSQSFALDGQGNFGQFDDNGKVQSRAVNAANEITSISTTAVPSAVTLEYDKAGNMTKGPRGDDPSVLLHYTYDAWNRLTTVHKNAAGKPGAQIASYQYDGLNRRTLAAYGSAPQVTFDYYYNENWQVLQVNKAVGTGQSQVHEQFVGTCATSTAPSPACATPTATAASKKHSTTPRTPTSTSRRWWTPLARWWSATRTRPMGR